MKRLCDILGLSRSSFDYWRRTAAARAARQTAEAGLAARIRKVHQDSDGTHGAPRITAELHDEGIRISHKRVARIMRTIGLEGVRLRRRHQTTVADHATPRAPDLIGRDFTAVVAGVCWLARGGREHSTCHAAAALPDSAGGAPGSAREKEDQERSMRLWVAADAAFDTEAGAAALKDDRGFENPQHLLEPVRPQVSERLHPQ